MKAHVLRNSVLQLAIEGKLVTQDPTEEPATVLMERIKVIKEQLIMDKKVLKKTSLPEIEDEEKLFDIPDSWEWVRLSDISIIQEGAGIRSFQYKITGIQLLTVTNILEGKIDLKKSIKYVSEDEYNDKYTHLTVHKGDIVTACSGASWGKSSIYNEDDIVMLNTSTLRLRYFSDLGNNLFLYYLTKSWFFKSQLQKQLSGMQPNFGYLHYSTIVIPLPPLAEQQRIVAKIEEIMPLIDQYEKMETELSKLEAEFPKSLYKSILQYAVQGKLVEQNKDDELADVLLEKIKAEKEQLIKEKKIKREKPLPEITDEEKSFDIPDGWEWVRLGEVVQINPRNKIRDDLDVSFIPMPLISDGYRNLHTSDKRKWKDVKSGFTHFQENDVAIAKITPCFENRKSVVFCNLYNGHGAGTTELHILRPYANTIMQKYLLWLIKTQHFIKSGTATYTGTAGQQRIGKEFVANYVFPLPPLAEQQRIVARVDELMALCDLLGDGNALNYHMSVSEANKVIEFKPQLVRQDEENEEKFDMVARAESISPETQVKMAERIKLLRAKK
jgi:type I restriction enzyme S subunit